MTTARTPAGGRSGKDVFIVAGVALAAALVMVLFAFRAQGFVANAGDPYLYGKIAHEFVEQGFTKLTRRAAMLYPHILWFIYGIGGDDSWVRALHVCLHVGTTTMTFVIGRHLFNRRTGMLAALAIAVHPMLLRYVADLHTETLLVFLATVIVFLSIRFHEEPTVRRGIALGGVGMIGAIAKGVLLPLLLAFGAVEGVRALRTWKAGGAKRFVGLVAVAATMVVVVAPWTYRNYEVTGGKFVLLTPGMPDAFLRGYIFTRVEFATLQKEPYTYAENESNALFRRIAAENGTTWELDEVQDDVNNSRVMKQMIAEHPFDTVRKVVVGMFTFWYEMTNLRNSLIPASLAIVGWALAFVGLRRAKEESRPAWLLWVPILALNVFVALLVPLGRYSVPILPCLWLLAGFGVDTLLQRREAPASAPAGTG